MDTFGEVKLMRQETGMTQEEFGKYLGIPGRTIQDWEREVRTPPAYVVRLMAYKLRAEGLIAKDGDRYEEDG